MDNLLASMFVRQHHNEKDEKNKAENTEIIRQKRNVYSLRRQSTRKMKNSMQKVEY